MSVRSYQSVMPRHLEDWFISLSILAIGVLLVVWLLVAIFGPGEADRRAEFMPKCLATSFTQSQCDILFAQAENSRDASEQANIMSGFAIGMAAGTAGARR